MARTTIDELLEESRAGLSRPDPHAAQAAVERGARLIDIRTESLIERDGRVPGALVIARNVLEWRVDPESGHAHPDAPELGDEVILMCDEGYASSLAVQTLRRLGFSRTTDLDGGFQAWRAAGLPVQAPGQPSSS